VLVAAGGIVYFSLRLPSAQKNPAPDFSIAGVDGGTLKLSDFRGRPLFLNFWSSW